MPRALMMVAGIGIALLLAGRAGAQGLVTERNLSLAMAKTIAEAALAECKSKGFNTAAAVVDRAGQVLVLLVAIFAFDLGRRWWRENEWKRRWRRGKDDD